MHPEVLEADDSILNVSSAQVGQWIFTERAMPIVRESIERTCGVSSPAPRAVPGSLVPIGNGRAFLRGYRTILAQLPSLKIGPSQ